MRTPIIEEPGENGDYLVAHSSRVTVFSPDGVARLSYAYGTPAATFVRELPGVVDHDWRR